MVKCQNIAAAQCSVGLWPGLLPQVWKNMMGVVLYYKQHDINRHNCSIKDFNKFKYKSIKQTSEFAMEINNNEKINKKYCIKILNSD